MYELNLFSENIESLNDFLKKFYNQDFDIKETKFEQTFQNPIDMIEIISAIVDNNEKYKIGIWISFDIISYLLFNYYIFLLIFNIIRYFRKLYNIIRNIIKFIRIIFIINLSNKSCIFFKIYYRSIFKFYFIAINSIKFFQ